MDEQQVVTPEVQQVASWTVAGAFDEGGPVMWVILGILILTIMIIVNRWRTLGQLVIDKEDFIEKLFGMVVAGQLRQAIAYCDGYMAPLALTLKAGLVQVLNKRPDEEVQVAMDAVVLRETPKIEGWTAFLAVFGNLATLAGLLGTITGMIRSFRSIAEKSSAEKATELSRGISEALNCTAFGLFVAIIAILAYGFYQRKVGLAVNDMVEGSMSLMNVVASNREKLKD
ncbi:MAG: MotA/TolQ/ExbB proton channel family protein [Pseudomonadota bacterium]|nr:MotA/TolQ/ExbB proton channel family protein [Pseudomonadota bacterium]